MKQAETIVPQGKQAVSETAETVRVETVETDLQRLRRDAVTYYRRSRSSANEETRVRNRATFSSIRKQLADRGYEIIEKDGTIITTPRKTTQS
jgi:hypothetical protein